MIGRALSLTGLVFARSGSFAASTLRAGEVPLGDPDLRTARAARESPPEERACSGGTRPARVVSASLLTDELLFDVLPFDRLVAVSYAAPTEVLTENLLAHVFRVDAEVENDDWGPALRIFGATP